MSFREYHYRWVLDLKAEPDSLWPFVADTNRFNRDAGLPQLEFTGTGNRLRNARRRIRLSVYGMPVEWEEQPFEWIRPVRFGVERVYKKGPMARMRALAQLERKPKGGTKLTYEIWAQPTNALWAMAIPVQTQLRLAPKIRAAFERYDQLACAGVNGEIGRSVTSVPGVDQKRLNGLRERLLANFDDDATAQANRKIVDRLVDYVEHRDDFAVARIRPYQLADDWSESRKLLLETCLRATRVGLLDLQWDLLCPLCRGAKVSAGSLSEIDSNVHCDTCRIDFKANFGRFVELTFRPNAAVRPVELNEYCVGSPQRSPHVVVQQLLSANEMRVLSLPLGAGNYRARALELPGAQTVTVSGTGARSANIVFSNEGPGATHLELGEISDLKVENQTDSEQLFILERTEWSDYAATAAEVTSLQMFRDLFSTEALRPREEISVGTVTVLFTDLKHSTQLYREIGDATAFGRVMNHFDVLKKAIAEHDGAVVKTIGDAVMAVFRKPAGAVLAMLEAQRKLATPEDGTMPLFLKAGLHSGPCIAVTLNERLDYFGSTVNLAARLEGLSAGTDVIISNAVYEDPEVQQLFDKGQCEATEFQAPLKGFDAQEFALWRIESYQRKPEAPRKKSAGEAATAPGN